MARKLRTLPRCEAEFEAGMAGPDGLVGDEHVTRCGSEGIYLVRVHDEIAAALGEDDDTLVLCTGCLYRLRQDIATGADTTLTILSVNTVPPQEA